MKLKTILTLILLTTVIGFGFISCTKDRTCKVLVIVEDSLHVGQPLHVVRLYCDIAENPNCIIDTNVTTLTDGTARFVFANPAILKLQVDGNPEGYVELEAGEEVEKIILVP